jgi:antitoxin component of MazEF toxin-antitoxin module
MKTEIHKIGDRHVVDLPPDVLAQFGWKAGDVLSVELSESCIKLALAKTKHELAMQIARRSFHRYAETYKALAK